LKPAARSTGGKEGGNGRRPCEGEPQGEVRPEGAHAAPGAPPPIVSALLQCEPQTPPLRGRSWGPHHRMGHYGLSWDNLGVKFVDRPRPALRPAESRRPIKGMRA